MTVCDKCGNDLDALPGGHVCGNRFQMEQHPFEVHRIDPCDHCDGATWKHCFRNGCAAHDETSARRLAAKEEFDRNEHRMIDLVTGQPKGMPQPRK